MSTGGLSGPPIYCTGGCDACQDAARELGVPLIVPDAAFPSEGLDVERLARALKAVLTTYPPAFTEREEQRDYRDRLRTATVLATEYARLAEVDRP